MDNPYPKISDYGKN